MSTGNFADPSAVQEAIDLLLSVSKPDYTMLAFVILFYGGYTILFSLYVYLQIQQRGQKRYYQISVLLLYMLATTAIVLAILSYTQETILFFSVLFGGDPLSDPAHSHFVSYENIGIAEAAVYVTANIVADVLLLYRCYIVWGARKYVVIGPFIISFVNTALALAAAALQQKNISTLLNGLTGGDGQNASLKAAQAISTSFLAVNLFTNILLTGLIAGRIWWISKATHQSLGEDGMKDRSLNGIVSMILESGVLYPIILAICLGLNASDAVSGVEPILTVIVGVAPTLIMVRTDLDISIRNNEKDSDSSLDGDDVEANRSALGSSYELRPTEKAKDLESQAYDPWANFNEGSRNPLRPGKGKEPQSDGTGVSGLRPLVNAHAGWDAHDAHDAPPPAFLESQQGSSTMLISAGPPLRRNEKSSQQGGMIVLRPPVIE
ncbi:hypothetical protein BDP27DRAFT_1416738 [Rhodocollybia butyracea]|uniref:Uncharacterized protein n=1 Tax=Rhodocollybia butyracea TaxID=206335 RepID=A0A9P5UDB5_9AGAR|nr:hypothetical protein BDP27DRAFT_1416738 [Rhodocollybia butyracea]